MEEGSHLAQFRALASGSVIPQSSLPEARSQNIYTPAPNSPSLSVPPEDLNSQAPETFLQVDSGSVSARVPHSDTGAGYCIVDRHGLCLLHMTSSNPLRSMRPTCKEMGLIMCLLHRIGIRLNEMVHK